MHYLFHHRSILTNIVGISLRRVMNFSIRQGRESKLGSNLKPNPKRQVPLKKEHNFVVLWQPFFNNLSVKVNKQKATNTFYIFATYPKVYSTRTEEIVVVTRLQWLREDFNISHCVSLTRVPMGFKKKNKTKRLLCNKCMIDIFLFILWHLFTFSD